MANDPEQVSIEFHDKANQVFFNQVNEFQTATATTNRSREEYVYQQIREQHIKTLRQKLEGVAKELLTTHSRSKQSNEMARNLTQFVNDYVHRFIRKIDAY